MVLRHFKSLKLRSVWENFQPKWYYRLRLGIRYSDVSGLFYQNCVSDIRSCNNMPQTTLNTLRQRQNGRHFPYDNFKWIFLNESVWISIGISLNVVTNGPINNIQALVRIMAWHRPGDKPLSEPVMISLLTHICVTRQQWFKVIHGWTKLISIC